MIVFCLHDDTEQVEAVCKDGVPVLLCASCLWRYRPWIARLGWIVKPDIMPAGE